MIKGEALRRIVYILDRYVTSNIGNVNYGNFPFITYYNGHMRLFNMKDATKSLLGWLIPVGIPLMISFGETSKSLTNKRNRVSVIGYVIGNKIYVHNEMFKTYVLDTDEKMLFTPTSTKSVLLVQGGWSTREQVLYSKFLWQFAIGANISVFKEVTQVDFDTPIYIDRDVLFREGWVVNTIAGRNVFYGIITCGLDENLGYDVPDRKYLWYNKYLTVMDITGGGGLQTFGINSYNDYVHPHIMNDGGLCTANAARMIQDRVNSGQMTEFFILMKDFLCGYNDENPFFHVAIEGRERNILGSKYLRSKVFLI